MDLGPILTPVVLQTSTGLVAAYGAWRCMALRRNVPDPRLAVLAAFFGLFGASVLLHAIWEVQIWELVQSARESGTRRPGIRPEGRERVNLFLLAHHLLMVTALVVAVAAFSRGRRTPADASRSVVAPALWIVPLALFARISDVIPLVLAAEAGLTLYLAVRALLNHLERRSRGALQVAAGFLLFFLGHLTFYVAHQPGGSRQGLGDILSLVGVVLLVQMLPGRR